MNILGMEIDTADIKSPYQFYRKIRPEYFSDSHIKKDMGEGMFGSPVKVCGLGIDLH